MKPSELREAIEKAVTTAKTLKVGDDKWDDMFYVTKTEQDVDAILDAVIAELPLAQGFREGDYKNRLIKHLQQAKSTHREEGE